jgi:transposase
MNENSTLRKAIEAQKATIASLSESHKKEVEALQSKIRELTAQVAWLKQQLFGRKSERRPVFDPSCPDLFAAEFADLFQQASEERDEAVGQLPEEKASPRKKRQARRMIEDLPVLEQVHIRPEGVDEALYRKIGEEVTRVVEHKPGQLYVREIIREKWGLRDNTMLPPEGMPSVLIAPMPLLPINKGIAGASLLSEVLLQKYEYHMPYYRQIQQFRHLGLKGLTESTVDGWFKQVASLLRPLYDVLAAEVMKSDYNQADETTTPVIDHGKKKAAKEYLWMVRAVMERLVLFHYDQGSRAGSVIEDLANKHNFRGYLQCDGFAGYETAFRTNPGVTLVNCMVHIRRHFLLALDENRPMAEHALGEIRQLYRIEHMCDEAKLTFDQRREKRQQLSRPIMVAMKKWMESEGIKYSESSEIGKAITYAYTRWDNMMHYLEDGRILLDNNLAENEIRPITLGRKNYLFCGNHEAAANMAVICSLLATCKAHDVNPRLYLNSIIADMPYRAKATQGELLEMLPHKWKLKHPEAIITKEEE